MVVDSRNNWVIATPIDANDKDVRNHAKYVRSFAVIRLSTSQSYPDGLLQQTVYFLTPVPNCPVPIVGSHSISAFRTKVVAVTRHVGPLAEVPRYHEQVLIDWVDFGFWCLMWSD